MRVFFRRLAAGEDFVAAMDDLGQNHEALVGVLLMVALRQRLGDHPDLSDISRFAADVRSPNDADLDQRHFEAVIRVSLGETWLFDDMGMSEKYGFAFIAVLHALLAPPSGEPENPESLVRAATAFLDSATRREPQLVLAGSEPRLAELLQAAKNQDFREPYPSFMYLDRPPWKIGLNPPRTVVGAWLKAIVLHQPAPPESAQLKWTLEEFKFLRTTFVIAVQEFFGGIEGYRVATRLAREIIASTRPPMPSVIETEAVVRAAMGDSSVSLKGIGGDQQMLIFGLGIGVILRQIQAPPPAVDGLISRSEKACMSRGWQPELMPAAAQ